jgi:hypothetical protein
MTDQPTDRPTDRPTDQPTDRPTDRHDDVPYLATIRESYWLVMSVIHKTQGELVAETGGTFYSSYFDNSKVIMFDDWIVSFLGKIFLQ